MCWRHDGGSAGAGPALQREFTRDSLKERLTYSRVVESVIWSLPLMNYKAMRDGLKIDGGVGYNDVAYNLPKKAFLTAAGCCPTSRKQNKL